MFRSPRREHECIKQPEPKADLGRGLGCYVPHPPRLTTDYIGRVIAAPIETQISVLTRIPVVPCASAWMLEASNDGTLELRDALGTL